MGKTTIIILGIVIVVIAWLVSMYNALVRLKNRVKEAWADIDVQLKRRYDLIPNLVETVRGYMKHEEGVFTKVTEARSAAMQATGAQAKAQAENTLSETLKSLFAVAENYPELKASNNFAKLQDEIADTENKIQAARRFYNGQVMEFNTKLQVFPTNIFARIFNFKDFEFFEITDAKERENIQVKF